MSVFQRMWKYKFHYIIVIPALLPLIVIKVIPFIMAILVSFRDVQPARGIMESPWIGWESYLQLWGSMEFANALSNTLVLKLLYIVFSGLLALILSVAISGIRSAKLRNVLNSVILLPYFVPTIVMAYIALIILSADHSPIFRLQTIVLYDPTIWRITVLALEIISTIGIPVIIATAAIHAHAVTNLASRITSAVRAILAFMLLQLSTLLSFDMELVYILANPPVNEVANTIDLYGFRLGYQFMQMSEASALWMTQFAIQLVLTILVYLIVRRWFFRDLFHPQGDNSEGQVVHVQPNRSYMGLVIALVYSLIALVPILFLILYPFMGRGTVEAHMEMSDSPIVPAQYLLYFLLILLVVIIYMMITVTLAYPLTVKDLPGRTLYKGFLLIILSAGTSGIHEYLLYRNLGLINTIIAPVFSGMVSIIGIFVLKSIFNRNYTQLKTQASDAGKGEMYSFFVIFIPKIWKPLIALGVLQFVTIWNAYLPSLIYIHQPNLHTPTATLLPFVFRLDVEMSEMMLKLGLVVSVPALILFVIFRKWLTSEVFVNEVRK